jgi:hypothetical protein
MCQSLRLCYALVQEVYRIHSLSYTFKFALGPQRCNLLPLRCSASRMGHITEAIVGKQYCEVGKWLHTRISSLAAFAGRADIHHRFFGAELAPLALDPRMEL